MKNLIIGLILLILQSCDSTPNPNYSKIANITTDTCWNTTKVVTHYNTSNNGAVGGGLLGGTAGWLLIGGPIGVIGGAIVGGTIGSNPKATSWTENVVENHCIYTVTLENTIKLKFNEYYSPGTEVDLRTKEPLMRY